MRLCVIGAGYVGLTTGVCLAYLGNHAICIDSDTEKIKLLRKGIIPIQEKGLKELMKEGISKGKLEFSEDLGRGVGRSDIIFIAVGTPALPDGNADLSAVKEVAAGIAANLESYRIIVIKSTVPAGTQRLMTSIIKANLKQPTDFDVVSNPEFLREGNAVSDTMHPDRVVIGADNMEAANKLSELYRPMNSRMVITDPESAEMIKYASNAFLAVKISFINEIANLCERVGADVNEVALGMGLDSRISADFLKAGLGYGGSCFPKDTRALVRLADEYGCSLGTVKSAIETNERQKLRPVDKLTDCIGDLKDKTVGVLGLAFKPNTDDIRQAPSLDIIGEIKRLGGKVKAYDPKAIPNAKKILDGIDYCKSAYRAAQDADAVILVTEWDEFKGLNLCRIKSLMKGTVFVDGRNLYDVDTMKDLGFEYYCIGRRDCGRSQKMRACIKTILP